MACNRSLVIALLLIATQAHSKVFETVTTPSKSSSATDASNSTPHATEKSSPNAPLKPPTSTETPSLNRSERSINADPLITSTLANSQALLVHTFKNVVHIGANGLGTLVSGLGQSTVYIGSFVAAMGARGIGMTVVEYGIGYISFGETLRRWFNPQFVQSRGSNSHEPLGASWADFGEEYLRTRLAVEANYANKQKKFGL